MAGKLANASRALGRLDGATEILPNADLFVYMYVRKEAVLSSQIEGTQASLIDILEHEAEADESSETLDVKEVVNYIVAKGATHLSKVKHDDAIQVPRIPKQLRDYGHHCFRMSAC